MVLLQWSKLILCPNRIRDRLVKLLWQCLQANQRYINTIKIQLLCILISTALDKIEIFTCPCYYIVGGVWRGLLCRDTKGWYHQIRWIISLGRESHKTTGSYTDATCTTRHSTTENKIKGWEFKAFSCSSSFPKHNALIKEYLLCQNNQQFGGISFLRFHFDGSIFFVLSERTKTRQVLWGIFGCKSWLVLHKA